MIVLYWLGISYYIRLLETFMVQLFHSSSAALMVLFFLFFPGVFNAEFVMSSVMRQEINFEGKTTQ